jgi:gliding motility-associated-like protein
MKITQIGIALIVALLINACGPKKTEDIYANACSGTGIFSLGTASIFIPTLFSPNGDGVNDVLAIFGNADTKYVTNLVISDRNNNVITTLDTVWGATISNKSWDGMIAGGKYSGLFNITCKLTNKNNISSSVTATSCVYTCDGNAVPITNKANCKMPDMFNPITGVPSLKTKESCF